MARVEGRIEHIRRVGTFTERKPDGILLVGVSAAMIPFIKLKGDMRLDMIRKEISTSAASSASRSSSKEAGTYRIVQFWDPAVGYRQPREQHEVD